MSEDISNKKLFGFVSIEAIVLIIGLAITWGIDSQRLTVAEDNIDVAAIERKELRVAVSDIKTIVGKADTRGESMKESITEIKVILQRLYEVQPAIVTPRYRENGD